MYRCIYIYIYTNIYIYIYIYIHIYTNNGYSPRSGPPVAARGALRDVVCCSLFVDLCCVSFSILCVYQCCFLLLVVYYLLIYVVYYLLMYVVSRYLCECCSFHVLCGVVMFVRLMKTSLRQLRVLTAMQHIRVNNYTNN